MAIKRPVSLLTIQIWTRSNTLVHYLGLSPIPSSFANSRASLTVILLRYKLEKRLRSVQKARRLVSFSIIKIFIIIMYILVTWVIQFLRVLSSVIQGEAHFQIYVSRNKGTVTQTCHNCLTSSAKKQDKSEYRKRNMREKPGLIQTGSPPDFSWEWVVGT